MSLQIYANIPEVVMNESLDAVVRDVVGFVLQSSLLPVDDLVPQKSNCSYVALNTSAFAHYTLSFQHPEKWVCHVLSSPYAF